MNRKAIMKPHNIKDVLRKLEHVTQIGPNEWRADCPCLGHTTPGGHLHVTDAGDKALLKCFIAHTYQDICSALGFESLIYGDSHRTEAIYDYKDADGSLVYQVLRMWPKNFRQRRPDGNGGWIYNLRGVRRVLYRLPQVLEAVRTGQTVYICEGEKDCDALARIGLVATTNSGGAEKWQPQLSESLVGASVVIIPDKDEPGKRHAAKVANSLYGKAKSITVLELPDREGYKIKDVSDWLMAGGTKEKLERLASEASDYKPAEDSNLVCMTEVEPEDVEWLWHPYIPLGKLTLLEGDPGIGKSWVSLAIATAVSLGQGLAGMEATEPAKVLVASAEDGLGDTIRPRLDAMGADVSRIYAIKGPLDFGNGGVAILCRYIEKVRPALVIIDPLVAYIGATVDIHRANETRAVMAKLADIAERHSVAILAIRHLTKGGTLKPIYRGLGSIDLAAACRSILMAGCDPEDTQKRGLVHIKSNLAPAGVAIGYKLTSEGFFWTGQSDLTWQKILSAEDTGSKSALDEATEFLRDELSQGTVSYRQVIADSQALGIAKRTLDRAKAQLGIIARPKGEPGRKGAKQWFWTLPGHLESQDDSPCQDDHINNSGNLNQNSYENQDLEEGFGNLNDTLAGQEGLERQADNLNDDYDSQPLLGLTPDQVIEIWRAEGSPPIKLSQCETCDDIARVLCSSTVRKDHVMAITEWLRMTLRPKGQPLRGRC